MSKIIQKQVLPLTVLMAMSMVATACSGTGPGTDGGDINFPAEESFQTDLEAQQAITEDDSDWHPILGPASEDISYDNSGHRTFSMRIAEHRCTDGAIDMTVVYNDGHGESGVKTQGSENHGTVCTTYIKVYNDSDSMIKTDYLTVPELTTYVDAENESDPGTARDARIPADWPGDQENFANHLTKLPYGLNEYAPTEDGEILYLIPTELRERPYGETLSKWVPAGQVGMVWYTYAPDSYTEGEHHAFTTPLSSSYEYANLLDIEFSDLPNLGNIESEPPGDAFDVEDATVQDEEIGSAPG